MAQSQERGRVLLLGLGKPSLWAGPLVLKSRASWRVAGAACVLCLQGGVTVCTVQPRTWGHRGVTDLPTVGSAVEGRAPTPGSLPRSPCDCWSTFKGSYWYVENIAQSCSGQLRTRRERVHAGLSGRGRGEGGPAPVTPSLSPGHACELELKCGDGGSGPRWEGTCP